MIALGLDPGFAKLGWSLVGVGPTGESVLDAGVITTSKDDEAGATEDKTRRARELALALPRIARGVDALCVESMSFTRDAVVAQMMGLAWGVVVAFAAQRRLPIYEHSPGKIRKALRAPKGATKKDIIAAVSLRYPELDQLLGTIRGELREHAADSVAAVVAALPDLRGRS